MNKLLQKPALIGAATLVGAVTVFAPTYALTKPLPERVGPSTPLPEDDDVSYSDTLFDPVAMDPNAPSKKNNSAQDFKAWVDAGMPGYIPDPNSDAKNGTHGSELQDPLPFDPPVDVPDPYVVPDVWAYVAQCESGGNWAAVNPDGYYGGLQFWQPTWEDFGGLAFAERADLASPEQQVTVAERVLAEQGWGAWPNCAPPAGVGGTTPPPPAQVGNKGQRAAAEAQKYIGWDYVGDGSTYGGTSPADGGFDCSGLVQWSWGTVGVNLPRSTWDQRYSGYSVSFDQLMPGDLVFYNGFGHVAIYVGNGEVVSAPTPGGVIEQVSVTWYGPINDIRRVG